MGAIVTFSLKSTLIFVYKYHCEDQHKSGKRVNTKVVKSKDQHKSGKVVFLLLIVIGHPDLNTENTKKL